jgi:hypothetical protein
VRDLVAAIVLAETVLGAGLSIWMLNLLFGIHGMCGPNLHFILGIPLLGVTVMAIPSLVGLAVSQALAVLVRHTPSWRSATRRVPAAAIVGIGLAIIYVILLAVKMNTRIFLGR